MPQTISRHGQTPEFYDLLTSHSLVPESGINITNTLKYQTNRWLYIPNYQRGVSWKTTFINESFITTNSPLLGNVILANWTIKDTDNREWVMALNKINNEYCHLLDGLQRFSTGTMLLFNLHSLICRPNSPHKTHLTTINVLMTQIGNKSMVFEHNHNELLKHPRNAISNQYKELTESYYEWLDNFLSLGKPNEINEYFNNIIQLFMEKQIAVDPFYGLTNITDIMNVFLGVNTIRIELNEIDLIRSYIVEKGAQNNWTHADIQNIENRFNDLFIARTLPKKNLLPFAILILEAIQEKSQPTLNVDISNIFPSFNTGFKISDIEDLLDFIEKLEDYRLSPFLNEIKEYYNPYCVVICHYYRYFLANKKLPNFLINGGIRLNSFEEKEMYLLYRSMIRTIVYRKPGKIKDKVCHKILHETAALSMIQISDTISSIVTSGTGGLSTPLITAEIEIELREISISPAKRIFNALELSLIKNPISFQPKDYGSKSGQFHIDHLTPKSKLISGTTGCKEGDKIGNFAPIPYHHNIIAKTTACSDKLKAIGGLYVGHYDIINIEFNNFLIKVHATSINPITDLDNQDLLSHNKLNSTTDLRIKYIAEELVKRI